MCFNTITMPYTTVFRISQIPFYLIASVRCSNSSKCFKSKKTVLRRNKTFCIKAPKWTSVFWFLTHSTHFHFLLSLLVVCSFFFFIILFNAPKIANANQKFASHANSKSDFRLFVWLWQYEQDRKRLSFHMTMSFKYSNEEVNTENQTLDGRNSLVVNVINVIIFDISLYGCMLQENGMLQHTVVIGIR